MLLPSTPANSAPPPTRLSAVAFLISSSFNSTRGAKPLPLEAQALRFVGVRTSHSSPKRPEGPRSVETAAVTPFALRADESFSFSGLGSVSIRGIQLQNSLGDHAPNRRPEISLQQAQSGSREGNRSPVKHGNC